MSLPLALFVAAVNDQIVAGLSTFLTALGFAAVAWFRGKAAGKSQKGDDGGDREQWDRERERLERKLRTCQRDRDDLADELQRVRDKRDELRGELHDARERIGDLQRGHHPRHDGGGNGSERADDVPPG